MGVQRFSLMFFRLKKAVYRKVCVFSLYTTYYLCIEIINTTNVAKAIINDNASYTLMLITSLSQEKPNTSNYLMIWFRKFIVELQNTSPYGCM